MDLEKDLSGIIASLMQDERIGEIVSSLSEGKKSSSPSDGEEKKDEKAEAPALDLSAISPEMIARLGPMVSAMLSGPGPSKKEEAPMGDEGPSVPSRDRKALLYALKPYLCDRRRALIDGLIQFEGLADIIGAMNALK